MPAQTPAMTRPSRVRDRRLLGLMFGSVIARSCPQRGRTDIRKIPINTLNLSQTRGAAMSAGAPNTDLLQIDDELTDEERLIRDTVRAFAHDRVLPHIEDWFEEGTLPRDIMPALGKLGVLGMHLAGYGCAGAGAIAYGVACRELEACESDLRSAASVPGSLSMYPIWRYGSEEQKNEWLPRMAAGEAVGCFGLTEPDHGSDPGSMRTFARKDGSDWVLSGTKMWITNGSIADIAVVWAGTEDGIRGFLVPRGTVGFPAREIQKKLSLRASITSELHLDDVRLPAGAALPGVTGLKGPLSCLTEARFGIAWGVTGAARTCLESAIEYAKTREQFGKPIASFQLTQAKLSWMAADLYRSQLLALHLGRLKEAGSASPVQGSVAKMTNVRPAPTTARPPRTVLGPRGGPLESPPIRHANNLEAVLTYEGTEEIHALAIGQALTGISAYR